MRKVLLLFACFFCIAFASIASAVDRTHVAGLGRVNGEWLCDAPTTVVSETQTALTLKTDAFEARIRFVDDDMVIFSYTPDSTEYILRHADA